MSTRRSTSRTCTGGRNKSESTRPSIVTSVPIPRARERTTASARRGLRASVRSAWRRSFISQSHHRIDLRRPARGHHRRSQSDGGEEQRDDQERHRVGGGHAEQQTPEHPGESARGDHAYDRAEDHEPRSLTHHQPEHITAPPPRATRPPNLGVRGGTREAMTPAKPNARRTHGPAANPASRDALARRGV